MNYNMSKFCGFLLVFTCILKYKSTALPSKKQNKKLKHTTYLFSF